VENIWHIRNGERYKDKKILRVEKNVFFMKESREKCIRKRE
jgi:hypothetical protein